jgi:hypothetical protein
LKLHPLKFFPSSLECYGNGVTYSSIWKVLWCPSFFLWNCSYLILGYNYIFFYNIVVPISSQHFSLNFNLSLQTCLYSDLVPYCHVEMWFIFLAFRSKEWICIHTLNYTDRVWIHRTESPITPVWFCTFLRKIFVFVFPGLVVDLKFFLYYDSSKIVDVGHIIFIFLGFLEHIAILLMWLDTTLSKMKLLIFQFCHMYWNITFFYLQNFVYFNE